MSKVSELADEARAMGATDVPPTADENGVMEDYSAELENGLGLSADIKPLEFDCSVGFGEYTPVGSGIRGVYVDRVEMELEDRAEPMVAHFIRAIAATPNLEGVVKDDPDSKEFELIAIERGMLVCVWGSANLNQRMAKYPFGAEVSITYSGKIPHPKKRGQSLKTFRTVSNAIETGKYTPEGLPVIRNDASFKPLASLPGYAG